MLVGMCADNAGMQRGSAVEIQQQGGVQIQMQYKNGMATGRVTTPPADVTI